MITNIFIENFKAFTKAQLNMAPLTLLTGLNGMGKTTFIQALLLLRQSYEKKLLPGTGLFLNGDYVEIGKGKDAYSRDGVGDYMSFRLEWDDKYESNFRFGYSPESDLQPCVEKLNQEEFDPFSTSLFSRNFRYLSAERVSPHVFFPLSEYHVKQLQSLGTKGEYTTHFIALNQRNHISINKLEYPGARAKTLLAQLDAWMGEITPGVRLNAVVFNEINIAKLGFKFEIPNGFTEEFSPVNVGFGLTYVLPVVTAILASKSGDLLIIENPESHLHPSGQAVIGKMCALAAENGVQVIIESHSDHILNGIRVAVKKKILAPENTAIYFFERDINSEKHKVDIIQPFIDEYGRLDKRPSGFLDEWGKQLDQLIE